MSHMSAAATMFITTYYIVLVWYIVLTQLSHKISLKHTTTFGYKLTLFSWAENDTIEFVLLLITSWTSVQEFGVQTSSTSDESSELFESPYIDEEFDDQENIGE